MVENQKSDKRILPKSDLDLQLLTTDSVWGSPHVNQDLKARLTKYYVEKGEDGEIKRDEKGNPKVTKEHLWGILGFYTRDMRLANLGIVNGELNYCKYFLDLAGDFLQSNMIEPFLICLSRVATVLELSQSKGGFLRKRLNTFTKESLNQELEPKKNKLGGMGGRY